VDLVPAFAQFAFTENYLLDFRLQWGKADTISLLTSALDGPNHSRTNGSANGQTTVEATATAEAVVPKTLAPLPADAPEYFSVDTPAEYISIIQNDWPYSGTFCSRRFVVTHSKSLCSTTGSRAHSHLDPYSNLSRFPCSVFHRISH
jgi:hypothetical protein